MYMYVPECSRVQRHKRYRECRRLEKQWLLLSGPMYKGGSEGGREGGEGERGGREGGREGEGGRDQVNSYRSDVWLSYVPNHLKQLLLPRQRHTCRPQHRE